MKKWRRLSGRPALAISIVALTASSCAGPMRPVAVPQAGSTMPEGSSATIRLDYYVIVGPEDRTIAADSVRVIAAIEDVTRELGLQPSETTGRQDGRAFPMFVGDRGEVALLVQCIRRKPDQTWVQITFFEGPEHDKQGRFIPRSLPRGRALPERFWMLLSRYLQ